MSVTFPSGDLLGQYLFSDGNAEDSSGQGNEGVVFQAANCVLRTADRFGFAGRAYDFKGPNSGSSFGTNDRGYIRLPH